MSLNLQPCLFLNADNHLVLDVLHIFSCEAGSTFAKMGSVTHTQLAEIDIRQQLLFGYSSSFEFKPTGQSHSKLQHLI